MKMDATSFVRRTTKLPSLPALYYDLVRAISNPYAMIDEICGIIRRDQSLTSRLLKLANSAFYGLPTKVGTLQEVVQIIGLREIQDLVLATSVIKAFEKLPTHLIDVPSFWQHSIACGVASSLLAEQRRDPMPERFFVGGLLHDIGRLIMFLNAPDESREILLRCESQQELSLQIEREVLGFDHAMLGAELILLWKLPRSLVEMVGCHHQIPSSTANVLDAFTVHYADFIVSVLEFGNSAELYISPLLAPKDCARYLLADEQMEELVNELDRKCGEIFPALTKDHG